MTSPGSENLQRGTFIEPRLRGLINEWTRCRHRLELNRGSRKLRAEAKAAQLALTELLADVVNALDGDTSSLDRMLAGRVTRVVYSEEPYKELGSVFIFTAADDRPSIRSLNLQEAEAIAQEHGLPLEHR